MGKRARQDLEQQARDVRRQIQPTGYATTDAVINEMVQRVEADGEEAFQTFINNQSLETLTALSEDLAESKSMRARISAYLKCVEVNRTMEAEMAKLKKAQENMQSAMQSLRVMVVTVCNHYPGGG